MEHAGRRAAQLFRVQRSGAGPRITTRIVLDGKGIATEIDATGNDYLKGPVDERFRIAGGKAPWSNKSEKGEKQLAGPAFYSPIDAILTGEMERALLAAPGGRLPLLPEGEASIERALDLTVEAGGKSQKVTLYEVSGLGFTPSPTWLAEDRSLFATASDWAVTIRDGGEAAWPALLEAQKAHASRRAEEVARKLQKKPGKRLWIQRARTPVTQRSTRPSCRS